MATSVKWNVTLHRMAPHKRCSFTQSMAAHIRWHGSRENDDVCTEPGRGLDLYSVLSSFAHPSAFPTQFSSPCYLRTLSLPAPCSVYRWESHCEPCLWVQLDELCTCSKTFPLHSAAEEIFSGIQSTSWIRSETGTGTHVHGAFAVTTVSEALGRSLQKAFLPWPVVLLPWGVLNSVHSAWGEGRAFLWKMFLLICFLIHHQVGRFVNYSVSVIWIC